MRENKGHCPSCDKKKAMKTVSKFGGRDWTGAMCKHCGHFVPDVLTKRYDLSCAGCKKPIPGTKSLAYYHHEMEKDAVQEVRDRLASAKDKLSALAKAPKSPATDSAAQNLRAAIDQIETIKIPTSWQERHETELGTFYCVDCHKKRRAAGNEFEEDTYVRHVSLCTVCGKTLNFHDIDEDKSPEEQAEIMACNGGTHTGECSARQEEIDRNMKAIDDAAKAVAVASPSSNKVSANV